MGDIAFAELRLNYERGLDSRPLEEMKAADSAPSHGPTAVFTPACKTFGDTINLDACNYTLQCNGSANVANRIISYWWNLTGTFIEFFSSEIASFTPTNTGDITISLASTMPQTRKPIANPCGDITLFMNTRLAYWSQGICNSRMGSNHDGEIAYNDITTFADSCVDRWNEQP